LVSTATCTAFRAVCGGRPGALGVQVVVSGRVLAQRVGWLSGLIGQMADELVSAHWGEGDLAVLGGGVGGDGRDLPSNGWMALRRLGWRAVNPAGVVVSDRVRRIAEEEAARALRLGVYRRAVIAALLSSWPAHPPTRTGEEWSTLRAVLPDRVDNATIRNRTRQIARYAGEHARLPGGVCDLEDAPRVARQVSLAAADRQQVVVDRRDEATVRVWVQLPMCPAPTSYRDWLWHALDVRLPPNVPRGATVRTPTLRPGPDKVRVDLPWQAPHTAAPLTGHTRAIGADWGVNTLLTATVADLEHEGRVSADGRPLRYNAAGVSAKLARLRRHREHLHTKLEHLIRLRDGRPEPIDPALTAKIAALTREHAAVCDRIRHLNKSLAWSAARWLVDHAIAAGASCIYLEDLTTLEPGGGSRSLNRRLSGQVRGIVFTAIGHLAAKAGIGVVTVPARGTSSGCPGCGNPVRHTKAPDRAVAGYRWTICTCGVSMDRDHAASQRIAGRGLANQTATRRNRGGTATIRTTTDTPVHTRKRRPARKTAAAPKPTRDRRKSGPTRKQARTGPIRTTSLPPSRRQIPAPANPTPGPGKRPAGRPPQVTPPGRQVPHTVPHTASRRPHRVRAAILGRGFHRHVHATPINRGRSAGMPDLPRIV
jgi:Putative transposase DNA-binding domain